ncbi:MAG: bifunctional [glutamate--ammonia ligase]-adenylyl-L-tyrosine phosphorylase/[glutamate--ammonia-ligase] adenylyltransferase [Saccharospirillum sp.]
MTLPPELADNAQDVEQWSGWTDLSTVERERLCRAALCSPWLKQWLQQQDDLPALAKAVDDPEHDSEAPLAALARHWEPGQEAPAMSDLRRWRNFEMARLIVRDANHLSNVVETARRVSDLADVAIRYALDHAHRTWVEKWGQPAGSEFEADNQQMVVIAMGKHGAQELNLSSDIDLIFAFPSAGETSGGRSHEEFFTRVGRWLIKLLDTRTAEGFVFRVDMRLRPWGQSGALVSNFTAMHHYYTHQGREWERYAMVKARAVTGAVAARRALEDDLRQFVYRRYVDFHALGALRRMKAMIQKEVRRQQLESNIKLGQGGIREVEFVTQAFQLIRGGQDYALQTRGTWPVLRLLREQDYLPAAVVDELESAYDFLRDLEHRIQALRDEQTQRLPGDPTDLARLAWSMGFDDTDALLAQLNTHRDRVHFHFSQVIAEDDPQGQGVDDALSRFWSDPQSRPDTVSESAARAIQAFAEDTAVKRLSGQARENLDRFMPMLLTELVRIDRLEAGFAAIRPVLDAIVRRTVYFVLLAENPMALRQLCRLVPVCPWIAENLQQKPYLLDELTDPDSLYRLPNKAELVDELHQALVRVPEDDLEQQMEVLRHFRHGRVLRAAACEVTENLPLMKISDYLAWVGEVVVDQALALVWQQMVARHGRPSRDDGDWCELDFGVVAYGKMGGLELSYESDLDLVFLHNAAPQGATEGPKVVDNVVFMARLGQKLIHMLSTRTPSGMLYEVDTRLRPSGNSGLLVSSLNAFAKYQQKDAWTWEHQALVRARFIAGDPQVKSAFETIRADILSRERDAESLRQAVLEMRQKMRDNLASKGTDTDGEPVFDLKQDAGGIVDVEFMVQYGILTGAHRFPDLTRWSDNIRCLNALHQVGWLTEQQTTALLDAYLELRQQVHRQALSRSESKLKGDAEIAPLSATREAVMQCWQTLLEPPA